MRRFIDKIQTKEKLRETLERLKEEGKKIVFTNGCFDIIHLGHIKYLREAKKLGDVLVVGLNSDRSVQKIKPLRPINSEEQRAEVIASLEMVDFVTIFEEETPYSLIEFLKPHILVKGGDWKIENIVGADLVEKVYSLPYLEGFSTTAIIEKIIEKYSSSYHYKSPNDIMEKAKKIKFLILDVDGVLTSGGIILDNENNELKIFDVRDGHGLVMVKKVGINVAVITGRVSKALERRMKELGISEVYQGVREKLKVFNEIVQKYGLSQEEIGAMGDDIIDLSILSRAGFSACPKDAHDEVKKKVHFVSKKNAGQGAVRELCDFILKSRGLMGKFIDEYKNL